MFNTIRETFRDIFRAASGILDVRVKDVTGIVEEAVRIKKKEETTKGETDWVGEAISKARRDFAQIAKLPRPESDKYTPLTFGEHPLETDEIWVEAWTGETGVRHSDLCGYVVLANFKEFCQNNYFYHPYRKEFSEGFSAPVGSSAIPMARRRIDPASR